LKGAGVLEKDALLNENGAGVDDPKVLVPKEKEEGLDATKFKFSEPDVVLSFELSIDLRFLRCLTSANAEDTTRSPRIAACI